MLVIFSDWETTSEWVQGLASGMGEGRGHPLSGHASSLAALNHLACAVCALTCMMYMCCVCGDARLGDTMHADAALPLLLGRLR